MVHPFAMIRRVASLSLLVLLAACAQQQKAAPVPASVVPRPARPVPGPAVPIPPSPPRGEPADFLNLPQANVRAMLGAPQFTRQDGATEMWRYDGAQCRAFIFFYGAQGSETVRHVETLPAGATSAADPLCLSALRSARRAS
jgi:hypothetical protein